MTQLKAPCPEGVWGGSGVLMSPGWGEGSRDVIGVRAWRWGLWGGPRGGAVSGEGAAVPGGPPLWGRPCRAPLGGGLCAQGKGGRSLRGVSPVTRALTPSSSGGALGGGCPCALVPLRLGVRPPSPWRRGRLCRVP